MIYSRSLFLHDICFYMTLLLWHWYVVKYCSYFFRVQVQCLLRGPEASVPIKVQVREEGLPLLFASLFPSTSEPSTGKSLAQLPNNISTKCTLRHKNKRKKKSLNVWQMDRFKLLLQLQFAFSQQSIQHVLSHHQPTLHLDISGACQRCISKIYLVSFKVMMALFRCICQKKYRLYSHIFLSV